MSLTSADRTRTSQKSRNSRSETKQKRSSKYKVRNEIRFYKSKTRFSIPKLSFQYFIREINQKLTQHGFQNDEYRFQKEAIEALLEATEAYMIQLFENSLLLARQAHRITIYPIDIIRAQRIKNDNLISFLD
ncbi:hypothetical protein PGB90_004190 [Kerria lacca]